MLSVVVPCFELQCLSQAPKRRDHVALGGDKEKCFDWVPSKKLFSLFLLKINVPKIIFFFSFYFYLYDLPSLTLRTYIYTLTLFLPFSLSLSLLHIVHLCMFVSLTHCLSVYMSVSLSVCLSVSLSVCICVCLSACLYRSSFKCLEHCKLHKEKFYPTGPWLAEQEQ
jgi:hypothetical protein